MVGLGGAAMVPEYATPSRFANVVCRGPMPRVIDFKVERRVIVTRENQQDLVFVYSVKRFIVKSRVAH